MTTAESHSDYCARRATDSDLTGYERAGKIDAGADLLQTLAERVAKVGTHIEGALRAVGAAQRGAKLGRPN